MLENSKPKSSRRRGIALADLVNSEEPINPQARVYFRQVQKYQEDFSRDEWRKEVIKQSCLVRKVPTESGSEAKAPKRKSGRKAGKKPAKESEPDVLMVDESDECSTPPLEEMPITFSQRTKNRLDRLKRASAIEIQRLKEHKDRFLANCDFNSLYDDNVMCEEDDSEILLKISYGTEIIKIEAKQNEKFSSVFSKLAEKCHVNVSELLLCLNDRNITIDDTPNGLGISTVSTIECFIYRPGDKEPAIINDVNYIKIKMQSSNHRDNLMMPIHKLEPMRVVMEKYAKRRNILLENITFKFDGEKLNGEETAEELDMEDESCVDVIVSK